MKYISNAISLGMLDFLDPEIFGTTFLKVTAMTLEDAQKLLKASTFTNNPMDWVSCIGHIDTAILLTELLGFEVEMNRSSVSLKVGDQVLVAQYNGPRLPEGAKSLPEGAKIRWYLVTVDVGKV